MGMNTQSIISTYYNQSLGLTEPWKVEDVKLDTKHLKVDILVVWPAGEKTLGLYP